jgi:hypothetical protein
MKAGILVRSGSCWIGAHWSPGNKRLCINFMPFVTLWIVAANGTAPKSKGVEFAEMLERKIIAAGQREES